MLDRGILSRYIKNVKQKSSFWHFNNIGKKKLLKYGRKYKVYKVKLIQMFTCWLTTQADEKLCEHMHKYILYCIIM